MAGAAAGVVAALEEGVVGAEGGGGAGAAAVGPTIATNMVGFVCIR